MRRKDLGSLPGWSPSHETDLAHIFGVLADHGLLIVSTPHTWYFQGLEDREKGNGEDAILGHFCFEKRGVYYGCSLDSSGLFLHHGVARRRRMVHVEIVLTCACPKRYVSGR